MARKARDGRKKKPKSHVEAAPLSKVRFFLIKSNQFRTIHVDGVHGGVTPDGKYIQAALFSQRFPIPRETVYRVEDGLLADEIREEREAREGPVREVEVNLIMDVGTAKSLADWIQDKVNVLEEALSKRERASTGDEPKKRKRGTRKAQK